MTFEFDGEPQLGGYSLRVRSKAGVGLKLQKSADGVVWHDITSGVLEAQALAAGSLDIGAVMNPISVILALANGNPMKIIDGFARVNRLAAILSMNPDIVRIEDLKGKTVAGLKGAVPHQLLIKALQSVGLSMADVTFLDMELTTTYTALLAKQVDAVVLAADLILKAKRAGAHEIQTPANLVQPINTACARDAFIAERPDLLRIYKDAAQEAVTIVAADPAAAIREGCAVNGLDLADGRELFGWQTFITQLTEADLASLGHDMDFLIEAKLCPRPVDLRAALWEAMAP